MKTTRTAAALLSVALLAMTGCGPWASSSTREVRIAIPWGQSQQGLRTKLVPDTASRITVRITGSGFAPIEQTIDRTGGTVSASPTATPGQPTVTPTVAPTATPTLAPTPTPTPLTVTGVTVSPANASIASGGSTTTLTATVSLSNSTTETTVTWSSSNTSIASVNASGVVTSGTATGAATITATSTRDTTKTGTATVNVVAAAGTSLGTFSNPGTQGLHSVAVDAGGNVWVVNGGTNNVTKYNGANGAVLGTFTTGSSPQDIAIDSSGNAWVTNFIGSVAKLDTNGNPAAGSPFPVAGCGPVGIAIDSGGNAWIACSSSGNVIKMSSTGSMLLNVNKVASSLEDVAIDSAGNVWVTHSAGTQVFKLANADASTLASPSLGVGSAPNGVAIDSSGNAWVALNGTNQVSKLNNAGTVLGTFTVGTQPIGVAIDNSGFVWVDNNGSFNVTRLANDGSGATTFSPGAFVARQPAIDRTRAVIYVPNGSDNKITLLSTGGPFGILALRTQQILPSPTPLPSAGVFDQHSQLVVLKFQVPIGNDRLLEATAFDAAGQALVGAKVRFNVPAGGTISDLEVNMTVQGLTLQPTPAPSPQPS